MYTLTKSEITSTAGVHIQKNMMSIHEPFKSLAQSISVE